MLQFLVAAQTNLPKCHLVARMKLATAAGFAQLNNLGELFYGEKFVSANSYFQWFPSCHVPRHRFKVPNRSVSCGPSEDQIDKNVRVI